MFFFFNDTATTEIYTLSLHDALPILVMADQPHRAVAEYRAAEEGGVRTAEVLTNHGIALMRVGERNAAVAKRSEEHTSELQSRQYLVCRLLLEKKTNINIIPWRTGKD